MATPGEEEIVVICHYGERSQLAAQELVECGFNVYNLIKVLEGNNNKKVKQ